MSVFAEAFTGEFWGARTYRIDPLLATLSTLGNRFLFWVGVVESCLLPLIVLPIVAPVAPGAAEDGPSFLSLVVEAIL